MSAVGSHVALAVAFTAVAGVLMSRIGEATGMLKGRATRRFCPCCGRRLSSRGCEHCGF
jgi:NADH pyrophosphatase NudC (nudix superfamily)